MAQETVRDVLGPVEFAGSGDLVSVVGSTRFGENLCRAGLLPRVRWIVDYSRTEAAPFRPAVIRLLDDLGARQARFRLIESARAAGSPLDGEDG